MSVESVCENLRLERLKALHARCLDLAERKERENYTQVVACRCDDPRKNGDKTMVALNRKLGPLPPCPCAQTGGGGWHLVFAYPEGVQLRAKLGRGVDVQADGDYIVVEPSRHRSGETYRWSVHPADCPPPPLPPAWLLEMSKPSLLEFCASQQKVTTLTGGPGGSSPGLVSECNLPYLDTYVDRSIKRTRPREFGTRNDCLRRFTTCLANHPNLRGKPFESVLPYYRRRFRVAFPRIQTKKFTTTRREAKALWETFDPCKQPIAAIAARALQEAPPTFAEDCRYKPALVNLVLLCRELVETVRRSVTIDWTVRESVRAKIRVMVRRILRKYGYPPDKQEKATQTVLRQAELLCAEWAA